MTHDELLDTIGHWNWIEPGAINALRAVVELHKPTEWFIWNIPICSTCETAPDDEHDYSSKVAYPCPTIQAIEKELK